MYVQFVIKNIGRYTFFISEINPFMVRINNNNNNNNNNELEIKNFEKFTFCYLKHINIEINLHQRLNMRIDKIASS